MEFEGSRKMDNKQKIRYMILKEINDENFKFLDEEKFLELDLGVTWDAFVDQVRFLDREGYITKPLYGDDSIYSLTSEITEKGENYLNENSTLSKLYKGLKEFRSWLI